MSDSAKKVTLAVLIAVGSFGILGTIVSSYGTVKGDVKDIKSDTAIAAEQSRVETGTKVETKRESISFSTETIKDSGLEYGKTATRRAGSNGEAIYTYEVTYENGKEVSRKLLSKEITKQPVSRIVAEGTKIVWHCVDVTSYDRNPYNDNKCTSSTGEMRYLSDSQAKALDPTYTPGKSGHWYYNSK